MNDWKQVARHGDSADEVRDAIVDASAAGLAEWEREQLAAGDLPVGVIGALVGFQAKLIAAGLDDQVERVMLSMAISAGAIGLH